MRNLNVDQSSFQKSDRTFRIVIQNLSRYIQFQIVIAYFFLGRIFFIAFWTLKLHCGNFSFYNKMKKLSDIQSKYEFSRSCSNRQNLFSTKFLLVSLEVTIRSEDIILDIECFFDPVWKKWDQIKNEKHFFIN